MSRSDKQKLVCGIGINDADYVTKIRKTVGCVDGKRRQKQVWICPFYRVWVSMLVRGYSEKLKTRRPTYIDVTVCEEWHTFSVFKAWMEKQDWEGNQLDKDLIVKGNKVYNPDTCVFVSCQVNVFLTDRANDRGEYKIGVSWHKGVGKFQSSCSNPLTGKQGYLGLFTTEQEAHDAWLAKKLEYAYDLAALQTDERVSKALINWYINYKEV